MGKRIKTVRKPNQQYLLGGQRLHLHSQLLNQDVSCVFFHAWCVINRQSLHQALVDYLVCRVETQNI